MSTDAVSVFLATLALICQLFLLIVAFFYLGGKLGIPAARNVLNDLRVTLGDQTLWLAAFVATVATLGSLYFSEVAHFPPCKLCWFQRIAMYPLMPMLLIAAFRKDRFIKPYVFVQAIIGALVSIYHVLVEIYPDTFETSRSCDITNPCATRWVYEFHYLTIPRMALTAFLTIIVLMLLLPNRSLEEPRG